MISVWLYLNSSFEKRMHFRGVNIRCDVSH